jgi:hypothetical protein
MPGVSTTSVERRKLQVRKREQAEIFSAQQMTEETNIELYSGQRLRAFQGDWIVSRGDRVIDAMTQARFDALYLPVGEPEWILAPSDRSELEKVLGFGATENSSTLTRAVGRLASLSIGDIPVNFTVTQWEELARRAEKRGMPIARYVATIVEKLLQDLWTSAI